MKKSIFQKLMTFMLTAGMVVSLSVPAFAANPVATNTKTVTIANAGDAASAVAYRVVKPIYGAEGFVGFQDAGGTLTLADFEKPTSAEVLALAKSIAGGATTEYDKSITLTKSGTNWTGNLEAGEYVVLFTNDTAVEGSAKYIYQPMIVSAYYTDANDGASLTVKGADASGNFVIGSTTAYAKRTTIPFDKTILNADGNKGADDDATSPEDKAKYSQGDDLGVGDTGNFQISTQIPAYTDAYKAKGVQYTITDTQDPGFDAPTNIVVKVGGTAITASATTFTTKIGTTAFTGADANDFSIDFASDFALAHAGETVVVTYNAKLNANATQKLVPNTDTAKLTYTNSVTDKSKVYYLQDDVEEYTFPVQVFKTDDQNAKLEGAQFKLTRTDAGAKTGTNEYTVTTDANGIAQFDRLDEGTYKLVETKAPAGYAINPDEFQIKITPTYNTTTGKLTSYDVEMKNVTKNTTVSTITVDNADDDILAGNILDTKLPTLPGTGGNGTAMAMMFAAGLGGMTMMLVAYGKKRERDAE